MGKVTNHHQGTHRNHQKTLPVLNPSAILGPGPRNRGLRRLPLAAPNGEPVRGIRAHALEPQPAVSPLVLELWLGDLPFTHNQET